MAQPVMDEKKVQEISEKLQDTVENVLVSMLKSKRQLVDKLIEVMTDRLY